LSHGFGSYLSLRQAFFVLVPSSVCCLAFLCVFGSGLNLKHGLLLLVIFVGCGVVPFMWFISKCVTGPLLFVVLRLRFGLFIWFVSKLVAWPFFIWFVSKYVTWFLLFGYFSSLLFGFFSVFFSKFAAASFFRVVPKSATCPPLFVYCL